jgi:hypothetical protein
MTLIHGTQESLDGVATPFLFPTVDAKLDLGHEQVCDVEMLLQVS